MSTLRDMLEDGWIDTSALRADSTCPTLVFEHRDGAFVVPLLPDVTVTVGRDPPSVIRPPGRRLSRQHAALRCLGGAVRIDDLGSTNGTFVEGRRVGTRGTLLPGEVAHLGGVTVRVVGPAREIPEELLEPFLDAMADEQHRVLAFGRPMTVAVLERRSAHPVGWIGEVLDGLRVVDRVCSLGTERLAVLLPECGAGRAREMLEALGGRVGIAVGFATSQAGAAPDRLLANSVAAAAAAAEGEVRDAGHRSTTDGEMVVASPVMRSLLETVEQVARSRLSVLIHGETGTGKEVVARRLHARSERADGPLRSLNCGAIPATLLEATLFGHVRGAFTGADRDRAGLFEEADGGTVFLDEVGELSAAAQVALLRVLETRRVQRVGSTEERPVDVRVIAATHRDLSELSERGVFRSDLLYRLNAVTLQVPPLRARIEAVPGLVRHFVAEANRTHGRQVAGATPEADAALGAYDWPGNVRELRNVVERAVVVCAGERFDVGDLGERFAVAATERSRTPPRPDRREEGLPDLKAALRDLEERMIRGAIRACRGNQSLAAERIDMPRRTLVYRLQRMDDLEQGPAVPETELRSVREATEELEDRLLRRALGEAGGDVAQAAHQLGIQRRTLVAKLRRVSNL